MSDQQRSQGQFLGASAASGAYVRERIQLTPEEIAEWRRKEEEQRKAYAEQQRKQARAELRDRFAMAALTGLLANPAEARISPAEWTYDAYRFADAMLKARGDD